jgi:orotate phosphoribosyltransferase
MLKSRLISIIKSHALTIASPNEPFNLSNGGTSNYFINCKNITLNPAYLSVIIDHIIDIILRENLYENLNHIAGVALGGCSIATGLSYKIFRDYEFYPHPTTLYIRSSQKDHGTKQLIEGSYSIGQKVLVVEDVITTGKSTLNAISVLENAGLEIVGVVSILDREQGGCENLSNYKYFPLTTISDILEKK